MKLTLERTRIDEDRKQKFELYTIGNYKVNVTTFEEYGSRYINIATRTEGGYFTPEVYCKDDYEGHILGFEIQTTSYGALNADEIQKVIAGYNEALDVVAILTAEFVENKEV